MKNTSPKKIIVIFSAIVIPVVLAILLVTNMTKNKPPKQTNESEVQTKLSFQSDETSENIKEEIHIHDHDHDHTKEHESLLSQAQKDDTLHNEKYSDPSYKKVLLEQLEWSSGIAHKTKNNVLEMVYASTDEEGTIYEHETILKPSDDGYQEVLSFLGDLPAGETKIFNGNKATKE